MKKQVLIRGVDEAVCRGAKSEAALQGMSMGAAVSDALRGWVESARREDEARRESEADFRYVSSHWSELEKHRGEAVVISGGKLQGLFASYREARDFAGRFRVALVFVVERRRERREIELGPDLEVQR